MTFGLRGIGVGILLSTLLIPAAGHARGCADFEILGGQVREDYNPFDPGPVVRNFTVSVRRLGNDAGSVRFLLVDDTPRDGYPGFDETGPADYQIEWTQDRSRSILVSDVQAVNNLNGVFVALPDAVGRTANVNFQLIVPRGQESEAGSHRQPLSVRFRCYNGSEPVGGEYDQSDDRLRLMLWTERFVSAYIAGTGRDAGRIDFGDISPASGSPTRGVKITTIGTTPFDVRIDTDNDGRLKPSDGEHDRARGGEHKEYGIGYAMRFGNIPVTSGDKVSCPRPTVPSGSVHDLDVTLRQEDIGAVPAGNYRDTITLTFEPRDGVWKNDCAITGNRRH